MNDFYCHFFIEPLVNYSTLLYCMLALYGIMLTWHNFSNQSNRSYVLLRLISRTKQTVRQWFGKEATACFTRKWSTVGLLKPSLLWSVSLHTNEPSWKKQIEKSPLYTYMTPKSKKKHQTSVNQTYSLWMLTTQLPSAPLTWCPPTILVLMCTKHEIFGLGWAEREDIFLRQWVRWTFCLNFKQRTLSKTSKVNHKMRLN